MAESGLPTMGGVTGPWSLGTVAAAQGAPNVRNLTGDGGAIPDQVAQAFMQLLSDPRILQMLAQELRAAGGGQGASPYGLGTDPSYRQGNVVLNPAGGMLMGTLPSGGPVQWLGGMPPGYSDKVAKTAGATALGGNLLSGMGGLGGFLNGLSGFLHNLFHPNQQGG